MSSDGNLGSGGAINLSSGTLDVTTGFNTDRSVSFAGTNNINVGSGQTFTASGNGMWSGTGNVTFNGPGNTTLNSGSGSYTFGTATAVAGNLQVNASVTGNVTVNTGGILSGTGSVSGAITVGGTGGQLGGVISPGTVASPLGTLSAGSATYNGGSGFTFNINNATGSAGANWNLLSVSGAMTVANISPTNPFTVSLNTFAGTSSGQALNFNTLSNYQWDFTTFGSQTGFNAADFAVKTSGFQNPYGGSFSIVQVGNNFDVMYTGSPIAVPEPGSLLLAGIAALGMAGIGYRRRRAAVSACSDNSQESEEST